MALNWARTSPCVGRPVAPTMTAMAPPISGIPKSESTTFPPNRDLSPPVSHVPVSILSAMFDNVDFLFSYKRQKTDRKTLL